MFFHLTQQQKRLYIIESSLMMIFFKYAANMHVWVYPSSFSLT
jgi:hypothetical protein